jgi:hypothetical protein
MALVQDLITTITELLDQADRPDQALRLLCAIAIDMDETNPDDTEMLQGLGAFLDKKVDFDTSASYRMGICGEYATIEHDGAIFPASHADERTQQGTLRTLCL